MAGQTWQQLAAAHAELVLTPPQIFGAANIRQWVRADRGVTVIGTGVYQWSDYSGLGNDYTQSTAGYRPSYPLDPTLAGLRTLLFDGTDDTLVSPLLLPGSATEATTLFAVVKFPYVGTVIPFGSSLTVSNDLVVFTQGPQSLGTSGNVYNVFTGSPPNTWARLAVEFSDTILLDNKLWCGAVRATNGVNTWGADTVGRRISSVTAAPWQGQIFEVIYVKGRCSTRQFQLYDRYVNRLTRGTVLL